MRGFSYTRNASFSENLSPPAVSCGDFVLHSLYCFMWGVCLTQPVLSYAWNVSYTSCAVYVGSVFYTPCANICVQFVLHTLFCFMWGVCLRDLLLFMRGVSILCGEILTCPMLLFYVGSFSYMPHAVLCGEFLLYALCCFMWGISLTFLMLFYAGSFSYTPQALLCMKVFLQAPHFCDQKADKPMQEQGVLGEVCVPCLRSSKCQLSSK